MKKLLLFAFIIFNISAHGQTVYTEPNGVLRCADIVPIPIFSHQGNDSLTRVFVSGEQQGNNIVLTYGMQYKVVKDSTTIYWVTSESGSAILPYDRSVSGYDLELMAFSYVQEHGTVNNNPMIRMKFIFK